MKLKYLKLICLFEIGSILLKGGVCLIMIVVKKMPGDSDDALIRKFSRKVLQEGIIPEAKRREFYLKPSLARKQKKEDARKMKKMAW